MIADPTLISIYRGNTPRPFCHNNIIETQRLLLSWEIRWESPWFQVRWSGYISREWIFGEVDVFVDLYRVYRAVVLAPLVLTKGYRLSDIDDWNTAEEFLDIHSSFHSGPCCVLYLYCTCTTSWTGYVYWTAAPCIVLVLVFVLQAVRYSQAMCVLIFRSG